jgi:hypothetical protein
MLACGVTNPPAAAIVVIFTTSPKVRVRVRISLA